MFFFSEMYVVIEIDIIAHHAYESILQCKNFTWFSKNAKVLLLTSLILDKKKRLQPSCQYFCSKVIFVQLSMKNYHSFKKKKSYFHFFFFCCIRCQFDAFSTFHHQYLFSQKKGGKFQEVIFVCKSASLFYVIFLRAPFTRFRPSKR